MTKFKVSEVKTITPNHQYEYRKWVFFASDWTHALKRAKERYNDLYILSLGVDPKKYTEVPLWVVSGPDCFPQLTLVKVKQSLHVEGLLVWGWSVYRRQPGFRTLGMALEQYIVERTPRFYLNREDAFARLAELIPEVVK